MRATEAAICNASGLKFAVKCPLMNLDKAGVWNLAQTVGGEALVRIVKMNTHTCYEGVRSGLHEWGYGCGQCDACRLRKKGWIEYSERQGALKSGRDIT
jgi:7-cyano-7-deazaguanine synthase